MHARVPKRRFASVRDVDFEVLLGGGSPLVADPWHVRWHLLHALLSAPAPDVLRLSDPPAAPPRVMHNDAAALAPRRHSDDDA
jgi:hypothetical protein